MTPFAQRIVDELAQDLETGARLLEVGLGDRDYLIAAGKQQATRKIMEWVERLDRSFDPDGDPDDPDSAGSELQLVLHENLGASDP